MIAKKVLFRTTKIIRNLLFDECAKNSVWESRSRAHAHGVYVDTVGSLFSNKLYISINVNLFTMHTGLRFRLTAIDTPKTEPNCLCYADYAMQSIAHHVGRLSSQWLYYHNDAMRFGITVQLF